MSVDRVNAVIAVGNLRTVAKLNKLEKVMGRKMAGQSRGTSGKSGFPEKGNTGSYSAYQQSAGMHFNHEVDLRGMRGSDALSELEKLMDRALKLGVEKQNGRASGRERGGQNV